MSEPDTEPASLPDADADARGDVMRRWLRSTHLLDLRDPKLRLRTRALTQLCKTDREKALAIYGFVKRIPFDKPLKMRERTAREVIDAGSGDAPDKAAVLIAMLRLARIPARLHYYEIHGDILQGLTSGIASATRAFAEIWLDGRWVQTDTYIFDAAYLAAARARLRAAGWEHGYGIHRDAHPIWNGRDPAYLGGVAPQQDPLVLADMGLYSDEREFVRSDAFQHSRLVRAMHWNLLASGMNKVIRDLRHQGRGGAPRAGGARRVS